MFGKSVTLFRILGLSVRADWSWLVVLALVLGSLFMLFHAWYHTPSGESLFRESTYVLMALGGTLAYFASIVFHELCHSLVARRYGLPMKGITLFLFGGVAEMSGEPPSAKVEFLMAIAGPLSSVFITAASAALWQIGRTHDWFPGLVGVFAVVAALNAMLVVFNLIPGFPLDGGRVLRSALWAWKGDLRWATRVASAIGSGFGMLLIAFGLISIVTSIYTPGLGALNGLWSILIGFFLRAAAKSGYRHVLIHQALEGEPVRRFMRPEVVTVPPGVTVAHFVDEYVYRYHYKMFPVVDGDRLLGCVSTRQISDVPRSEWSSRTVLDIARTCSPGTAIGPGEDALSALTRMSQGGPSRLMVVEDGRLVGIITLRDLFRFLALKMELDRAGNGTPPKGPE